MSNKPKNRPAKAPAAPKTPPLAGWGRRISALLIDWVASTLVFSAIVGFATYAKVGGGVFVPVVLFVEIFVFTALLGGSFGQIALGIRIRRTDGSRLSPWAILIRTLLIMLVIPPVIYKPDGRGLHDMAVDSAAFRLP